MGSIEQELEEIKSEWDVEFLDNTDDQLYLLKLRKEETTLLLSIPVGYPNTAPEFQGEEMKKLEEKIGPGGMLSTQQVISVNIGKPMISSLLENIMKHTKTTALEKDEKLPKDDEKIPTSCRKLKKNPRYRLACSFDVDGANSLSHNVPENRKSTVTNERKSSQRIPSPKAKKKPTEVPAKEKAPPMNTARDVINRLKWDDKLKDKEFIVGYKDRFSGIIEVPVFDLNWYDDIASTGPADKLAIPEHRVQYFKYKSEKIWDKSTRTDLVFGSTGKKIDFMKFLQRVKEKDEESNERDEKSYVEALKSEEPVQSTTIHVEGEDENLNASQEYIKDTQTSREEVVACFDLKSGRYIAKDFIQDSGQIPDAEIGPPPTENVTVSESNDVQNNNVETLVEEVGKLGDLNKSS